jgi:hypothetical protein
VGIAPGDYLMAVNQSNLELADLDDFIVWETSVVIEVSSHDMNIWCQTREKRECVCERERDREREYRRLTPLILHIVLL